MISPTDYVSISFHKERKRQKLNGNLINHTQAITTKANFFHTWNTTKDKTLTELT